MTFDQSAIIGLLTLTLIALAVGRWRHDVVAVAALLAAVVLGLVPGAEAFAGLGNAAVVTVAAILIIGRTISATGVLDALAERMSGRLTSPALLVTALCAAGAAISAFMNNVGALALMMPVALTVAARQGLSPSRVLMPLSFATLLGGLVTLVGTPANLVMAQFREDALGAPPGLFSLGIIGVPLAVAGVAWLGAVGWRLLPDRATPQAGDAVVFGGLQTELRVVAGGSLDGVLVEVLEADHGVRLHGVIRNGARLFARRETWTVMADDLLLVEAEVPVIEGLIAAGACVFAALPGTGAPDVLEVVVPQQSVILGSSARSLDLRERFGVVLLAAARQGRRFEGRLEEEPFAAGDVLMLAGSDTDLHVAVEDLGLLLLRERATQTRPRNLAVALAAFGAGLVAVAMGVLPAPVAFVGTVLALLLAGTLSLADLYRRIDFSVVVLLAALIPLGDAFAGTGAASLVAEQALALIGGGNPHLLLVVGLLATIAVTQILNNVATVVVMAPLVISGAQQAGFSPDPFLLAVAVGASCAFLTPFGHHNNTIVMGPGRYRFGDYWRPGLALVVLAVLLVVFIAPLAAPFGGQGG